MSVENVINVYRKIFEEVVSKNMFDSLKFRNTLEPIFEREGFRQNMFDPEKFPNTQFRIMILQDASIGDFVLLSPCIRELRRIYPAARISLVINSRVYELAKTCPYVDEIIPFDAFADMRNFKKTFEHYIDISKILLERHFDLAFLFNHFMTTTLLGYMSGASDRIITQGQVNPLNFKIPIENFVLPLVNAALPRMSRTNHYVDKNLKMLDHFLHSPVINRELEIWYSPQDLSYVRTILSKKKFLGKKIYTLTLGGTRPDSWYSPEQYSDVFKMIFEKDPDVRLILLGWYKEKFFADVFLKHLGSEFADRVWNLVAKLELRQTAALLSLVTIHIGNDTGTMHIAAANRTPCLEVSPYPADQGFRANTVFLQFAPYHVPAVVVHPAKSLPECVGSQESHGCRSLDKPHCIKTIPPEKVFEGYNLLLEKISNRDRKLSLVH